MKINTEVTDPSGEVGVISRLYIENGLSMATVEYSEEQWTGETFLDWELSALSPTV